MTTFLNYSEFGQFKEVHLSPKNKEKDDFEKPFEFYYDYPATEQLQGAILSTAQKEIFDRITQDIFNESLAKW